MTCMNMHRSNGTGHASSIRMVSLVPRVQGKVGDGNDNIGLVFYDYIYFVLVLAVLYFM